MNPTEITKQIIFTYTVHGEPIFLKSNKLDCLPSSGSLSTDIDIVIPIRSWTPTQLEAMAKFLRENPDARLMDGN
jgi:hypothetical protein